MGYSEAILWDQKDQNRGIEIFLCRLTQPYTWAKLFYKFCIGSCFTIHP